MCTSYLYLMFVVLTCLSTSPSSKCTSYVPLALILAMTPSYIPLNALNFAFTSSPTENVASSPAWTLRRLREPSPPPRVWLSTQVAACRWPSRGSAIRRPGAAWPDTRVTSLTAPFFVTNLLPSRISRTPLGQLRKPRGSHTKFTKIQDHGQGLIREEFRC